MTVMRILHTRPSSVRLVALAAGCMLSILLLSGCGIKSYFARERCYIEDARFVRMKNLFVETNSLQQVEQAMENEGWSTCEKNEFRYRLRKDLNLETSEEPAVPGPELLP